MSLKLEKLGYALSVILILVLTLSYASADPNHPPILDLIGGKQASEGSNLSFTITAADEDNDNLTFSTNSTLGALNQQTGEFSWLPGFDQAGIHFVQFSVSDGIDSDSEIIMLNVTEAGNHAPTLDLIGGQQVNEGQPLEFTMSVHDQDNDVLAYSTNFTKGVLNSQTGYFSWGPGFNEAGIYFAKFTVSDGQEQASEIIMINITEYGNHIPILFLIGGKQVNEGQSIQFQLQAVDLDDDTLTFTINETFGTLNPQTGDFYWMPNFSQSGLYFVQFGVSDGMNSSYEIIRINVTEVDNHRPTLSLIGGKQVNEGQLLEFTINASDTDGDELAYSTNSTKGALNPTTGHYSWLPNYNESGIYYMKFTVSDGNADESEIIMVNITETGNHAPVLSLIGGKQANEGQELQFQMNATDLDNDNLAYSKNESIGTLDATGLFSWSPGFNNEGVFYIRFSVSDGTEEAFEIIMVNITEAGSSMRLDSSHIKTNYPDVSIEIDNSTQVGLNFSGIHHIVFKSNNEAILEFGWNFSSSDVLDLGKITVNHGIVNGTERLFVSGIGANITKTIYLNKTNAAMNSVCIKDAEISSVEEISSECNGQDEVKIRCDGSLSGSYSCSDLGARFRVGGLRHSGVGQAYMAAPQSSEQSSSSSQSAPLYNPPGSSLPETQNTGTSLESASPSNAAKEDIPEDNNQSQPAANSHYIPAAETSPKSPITGFSVYLSDAMNVFTAVLILIIIIAVGYTTYYAYSRKKYQKWFSGLGGMIKLLIEK